jgi:hypothetical protein
MVRRYFTNDAKRLRVLSGIVVVLSIAAIGTYLLAGSHAATPFISVTAPSGNLSSTATNCPFNNTSTGSATVFHQAIPMDGKVALSLSCPGNPFSPSSFWNTSLPASTPVNVNSAAYVAALVNEMCHPDTGPQTGPCTSTAPYGEANTTDWSVPFYVVPANQPCNPVVLNSTSTSTGAVNLAKLLSQGEPNQSQCQGVPIPADAQAAAGTDGHIAIYQSASDTLWEFWRLSTPTQNIPGAAPLPWNTTNAPAPSYGDSQWHAVWGGVMTDVSSNNGVFPPDWAGWASGVSLLGSVIRIEELQTGQIDHVMGLGAGDLLSRDIAPANTTQPGDTPADDQGISWPADDTDGTNTSPLAIPEGLHLRLPANLDLNQYDLSPVAKVIAIAAQKYGFVVDDTSNVNVGPHFGDPTPYIVAGLPNPYTTGPGVGGVGSGGLFAGVNENQVMNNFPWDQLQALPFNYGEPSQ